MNLLILTAITVIGIIGVIGTVEYSHAQTPLTIPPTNLPDAKDGSLEIKSTKITNTWTSASNDTIRNTETTKIGHIYYPLDNLLEPNPIFSNVTQEKSCTSDIRTIKTLLTVPQEQEYIPNLRVPSNIPDNNNTIHAIGLDIYTLQDGSKITCTAFNLEATSKHPLITKKEMRVTITDKHDKAPYYFSPRDNIMEAQPIPLCSNENFNTETQTLKGETKMCYGKNGNDMVIMTKRLTGIYGTTETITTPDDPIRLDSDITETVKEYEQEQAYLALLKKLYLPAV